VVPLLPRQGIESIAREFPEAGHLLLPVFVAIVVGTIPVLAGLATVWQLAEVATAPSAAFSARTLGLLRRLRVLVLLPWIAIEAMGIFAFSLVSLLDQLFRRGVELRVDSEPTV